MKQSVLRVEDIPIELRKAKQGMKTPLMMRGGVQKCCWPPDFCEFPIKSNNSSTYGSWCLLYGHESDIGKRKVGGPVSRHISRPWSLIVAYPPPTLTFFCISHFLSTLVFDKIAAMAVDPSSPRAFALSFISNPRFHQNFTIGATPTHGPLNVSYAEYGKEQNESQTIPTLLLMPGMFSSRYLGLGIHVIAEKLEVRLLVVDR
jgi:hypothetical protein